MDAVFRRYMDILYKYVLEKPPPERKALFLPSDRQEQPEFSSGNGREDVDEEPPAKKQKREKPAKATSPNLVSMQAHLFRLLRPLVAKHTNVRDALARCRAGDIDAFENVLALVEEAVKQGLTDYEAESGSHQTQSLAEEIAAPLENHHESADVSSRATVARLKRPWWICQPYVRPLPKEALEKGSLTLSKKEKARLEKEEAQATEAGLAPSGRVESEVVDDKSQQTIEVPKEGLVCG